MDTNKNGAHDGPVFIFKVVYYFKIAILSV
jgi:hypothetical protein